jgi:hypothetical protein
VWTETIRCDLASRRLEAVSAISMNHGCRCCASQPSLRRNRSHGLPQQVTDTRVTLLRKRAFSCSWKHWQRPKFSDRFSISWQRTDLRVFNVNISKLRWTVCFGDVAVRLEEYFGDRRLVCLFDKLIDKIQWSVCFSGMSVRFGALFHYEVLLPNYDTGFQTCQ